jgi:hypothetical protein
VVKPGDVANTLKKSSGSLTFAKSSSVGESGGDLPIKNMSKDIPKVVTTIHRTVTPMLAPYKYNMEKKLFFFNQ